MKFIISREELSKITGKIQNVVSSRATPTIPILSNILIEAHNGEVIFTATDLTVGVRCFSAAKVLEEGSTAVSGRRFLSLVRELTASNVEIVCNNNDVMDVTAGTSHFKLLGKSASEFPALPDLTGATQFKIAAEILKEMFYRTSFAVSRDDNRYALTGVLMQLSSGEATFVGTDGKRLAKAFTPIEMDLDFTGHYIFPIKAVDEITKTLSDGEEVTIHLLNDKVAVEADNSIVITKLLTGDYPNVSKVIPESPETSVSLHREELATLLRQMSLFTTEDCSSVRFAIANGELKLSVNNSETGEGKVSMPIDFSGDQVDIAFNPGFFLDILSHTKDETVRLGISDAFNPGVITDASPGLFVLMPMRLHEE